MGQSLKWIEGRQGSGYFKMPLWISERFKFDVYLIKIPEGVVVPTHTDPAVEGYTHHRINFTYRGFVNLPCYRMYVLGKQFRFWRFTYFRPDKYAHGLRKTKQEIQMLSIGWLRRVKTN